MTFSSALDWAIFLTCDSLLLIGLAVLFRRKLFHHLFFFTCYLMVSLISDVAWGWIYRTGARQMHIWFYLYWGAEFLLSVLRLLAFAEIAKRILRGYPAVFAVASWLLIGAGTILLTWTAHPAMRHVRRIWPIVLLGDQRLALMQALLLLVLLALCAYYRIAIPPYYRLILIGIGIYCSLQVVNNELLSRQLIPPDSIPDYIRRTSIVVSIAIWTYAVWHWSAASEADPQLIAQGTYDEFSPQIHERMRELSDRLAELFS